jgi:hypothetical protein
MHRRGRLRRFAFLWAVLQLALPASATIADAMAGAPTIQAGHVEATPGGDCAPSHPPDCAVCKHLSTLSLGPRQSAVGPSTTNAQLVSAARALPLPRILPAFALPRAPPRGA